MRVSICLGLLLAAVAIGHEMDVHDMNSNHDNELSSLHGDMSGTDGMDMSGMSGLSDKDRDQLLKQLTDQDVVPRPGPDHVHGLPILDSPHFQDLSAAEQLYWLQYNTTSFATDDSPAKGMLWAHVALNTAAWVFLYPVSVLISTLVSVSASSVRVAGLYLMLQTVQVAVFMASLLCLAIYGFSAPDLYPNNAYARACWAMLVLSTLHWLATVARVLTVWTARRPLDGAEYVSARGAHVSSSATRPSQDSGLFEEDEVDEEDHLVIGSDQEKISGPVWTAFFVDKWVAWATVSPISGLLTSTAGAFDVVYYLLNRTLVVVSFFYLLLGIAVFYRMGLKNEVFGLLAHFIKGGVFFLFGLLTLGRYLGAFADLGMAWNIRPGSEFDPDRDDAAKRARFSGRSKPNIVARALSLLPFGYTMEFSESFTVLVYGCTNVFMEHLGSQDGSWSHEDLQHASIAFMYIGGGLCGVLVESRTVRAQLSRFVGTTARQAFSFNPFPAFIVFWTGVLMSQHVQPLPLGTAIHMQWGYLLCAGAVLRGVTYALLFVAPPQSTEPSRPFSELMVAFCLICGGMVFMESNGETVYAMVYRGLDAMFTLNVSVGVSALVMSWMFVAWQIRSWVETRFC